VMTGQPDSVASRQSYEAGSRVREVILQAEPRAGDNP
jgi:hypothetical protein